MASGRSRRRDARLLILRSDLPKPMFNARLYDADGVFIATVDAWWPEAGVAAEVDSRAYHLGAEDQDRTTERHDRLIAHGIFVLHFPPKRIKTDRRGVISDLRSAIEKGLRRPPLPITALPRSADATAGPGRPCGSGTRLDAAGQAPGQEPLFTAVRAN